MGGRVMSKQASFEALYEEHHRTILACCARRASRADAWDAAPEVFLVAWRRFDQVPPPDEARAWLIGVAYKVLANQRRGERRRRRLLQRAGRTSVDSAGLPEVQLIRNEEEAEVVRALSNLRSTDREIIQLSLWEELSPVVIAEVLGISRAAVDQRYARAKQRLAKELDRQTKGRATPSRKGGVT